MHEQQRSLITKSMLRYAVKQSGHRLAGVNLIRKYPLQSCQQFHCLLALFVRMAVPVAKCSSHKVSGAQLASASGSPPSSSAGRTHCRIRSRLRVRIQAAAFPARPPARHAYLDCRRPPPRRQNRPRLHAAGQFTGRIRPRPMPPAGRNPSFAASAAVWRTWSAEAPAAGSTSAPARRASAAINSSLRSVLPPKAGA